MAGGKLVWILARISNAAHPRWMKEVWRKMLAERGAA